MAVGGVVIASRLTTSSPVSFSFVFCLKASLRLNAMALTLELTTLADVASACWGGSEIIAAVVGGVIAFSSLFRLTASLCLSAVTLELITSADVASSCYGGEREGKREKTAMVICRDRCMMFR